MSLRGREPRGRATEILVKLAKRSAHGVRTCAVYFVEHEVRKQLANSSHLSFHQPLEEVKAVAITLQSPYFACCSVLLTKFLRKKKTPVPCDALDAGSHAALGLECHNLVCMQPMLIVHFFERFVKAGADEFRVECRERGKNPGKKLFKGEWRWWLESIEGGSWGRIGGIQTNANDREELRRIIMGIDENAANLDETLGRRIRGIYTWSASLVYRSVHASYRCHWATST